MASLQTRPYSLQCAEGESLETLGVSIRVKATTEQTGGVFNLFDVFCPPGFATPLHIHYTEDVAIYILEGTLTFIWGNDKQEAERGAYLYHPRGTPHGFRVEGTRHARILYLTFPAGFDRFVLEQERLATFCDAATTAAKYKIEELGPLPE